MFTTFDFLHRQETLQYGTDRDDIGMFYTDITRKDIHLNNCQKQNKTARINFRVRTYFQGVGLSYLFNITFHGSSMS